MSQLLVSVRSPEEARAAIAGGCDLLDLKEPARGPLGMPEIDQIQQILAAIGREQISLSLALGELEEWPESRVIPSEFGRFTYLKIGPGSSSDLNRWTKQLGAFHRRVAPASPTGPSLIAVIYWDHPVGDIINQSSAEATRQLIHQLKERGFQGLLLDTQRKCKLGSIPHWNLDALRELSANCREAKMLFALAGQLTEETIRQLLRKGIHPDYFGVRSAACEHGDRSRTISESRVNALKEILPVKPGINGAFRTF